MSKEETLPEVASTSDEIERILVRFISNVGPDIGREAYGIHENDVSDAAYAIAEWLLKNAPPTNVPHQAVSELETKIHQLRCDLSWACRRLQAMIDGDSPTDGDRLTVRLTLQGLAKTQRKRSEGMSDNQETLSHASPDVSEVKDKINGAIDMLQTFRNYVRSGHSPNDCQLWTVQSVLLMALDRLNAPATNITPASASDEQMDDIAREHFREWDETDGDIPTEDHSPLDIWLVAWSKAIKWANRGER